MFGLGDIAYHSYVPALSMGYASIAQRSQRYINDNNPAATATIDTLTFISDISLIGKTITLKNLYTKTNQSNVDINFFAFGFPIMKHWKTSAGLTPFSNMGYNILEEKQIDTLYLKTTYKGEGGLNKLFLNNAFDILNLNFTTISDKNFKVHYFHKISYGFQTSYFFGSLDKYVNATFPNDLYIFDHNKTERLIINGFGLENGIQYEFLKQEDNYNFKTNKFRIIIGFKYKHLNNLNAKHSVLNTKFININGQVTKDTIENTINKKGKIQLPQTLGFGFTIETNNKFTWSNEISYQNWSNTKFFNEQSHLQNSLFIGSGIQYIPDPTKFYYYWKMINYRFGMYFYKSYLKIEQKQINEFGITFGLGLPITKTDKGEGTSIRKKLPPMLNFQISYGNRGLTEKNLIKEQFLQFSIALNLHDIWFVKRKYN
jgi:hypothetical protein